ncbi:hypothetical protein [Microcoleus sp. D2_18a_D3]|uniref:hypothetical protein n=1 Tax=Microcoleus sp. D2_18a_D3 TaxID=3055330 RepID=UPI002FCEEC12
MNPYSNENTERPEATEPAPITETGAVPIPETTISRNLSAAIPQPEVSPDLTASLIHLLAAPDKNLQTTEVQNAE